MRLNPMQMERLAGTEEFAAGKELEEAGSVRVSEQDSTMVRYTVAGKPPRTVTLGRSLVLHCDCDLFTQRGCCRHAIAAWLAAERAGIPEGMLKRNAPQNAAGLTDLILRQMPSEPNVHAIDTGETLVFGKEFTYQPAWMRFSRDDTRVLDVLRKLFAGREGERTGAGGARLVHLPDPFTREILEHIGETALRIMDSNGEMIRCRQIRRAPIALQFEMSLGPRGLRTAARMPADLLPVTEDCAWVVTGGNLIRTEENQRELIMLIWKSQYEGRCLFDYPLEETDRVIGEVLPYLKLRGAVEILPFSFITGMWY